MNDRRRVRQAVVGSLWSATLMPDPTDLRRHRSLTDRNLLLGFFAILFIVGGALIFLFYGGGAAALGVACMAVGAILAGVVTLVMLGLEWLSRWLDRE
jgi:hypothetical protein